MKSRLGRSLTFRGKDEIAKRSGGKPREKQDGRAKNEREGARIESKKKKREERRVRIMHYSWWLLGLREKGLCSISVFETSTLPSGGSEERTRAPGGKKGRR